MTSTDIGVVLTPEEVAEILRCPVEDVADLVQTGALPTIRIGQSWRVTQADLRRFLEQPPPAPEAMLTLPEVYAQLRSSRTPVSKLIASGELPSVKVGRRRLVRRSDLLTYMAKLPVDPTHSSAYRRPVSATAPKNTTSRRARSQPERRGQALAPTA